MTFELFDYVNIHGVNEFSKWSSSLQKVQLAKLNEKLDALAMHGDALHPHMLTDTHVSGIKKLRVQGNVKLRPLLCNGPADVKNEYTLLKGAKEIGGIWSPAAAPKKANQIKTEVSNDLQNRRKKHERVS